MDTQKRARDNGGLALYRATAVTTLRDQLPNACADFCQPVLRPTVAWPAIGGWWSTKEPAEIEPPLSKITTSQGVPGGACACVAAGITRCPDSLGGGADCAGYSPMVDGIAREQATNQALTAAAEVAAALQARLIEEHNADPERAAALSTFATSLKLRQARECFGQGLRAAGATSPSMTRSVCATDDQQAHLVTCRSAACRCVQPFALREG